MNEQVAANLRRIIQERKGGAAGLSQRELARRVGCSSAHMTHLLSGRSPLTLDWLGRICAALPVDPARLLGGQRSGQPFDAFDLYDPSDARLHEGLQHALEHGFRGQAAALLACCRKALRRTELMCRLLRCAAKAEGVALRRASEPPLTLYSSAGDACGRGWHAYASHGLEVRLLRPEEPQAERLAGLFLQCVAIGGGL